MAYRRYLQRAPDAPDREDVLARIYFDVRSGSRAMSGDRITGPFGEARVSQATHAEISRGAGSFRRCCGMASAEGGLSGQWGSTPFSEHTQISTQFANWIDDGRYMWRGSTGR